MWLPQAAMSSSEELQQVIIDQEEDIADKGYLYVWISPNDPPIIVLAESRVNHWSTAQCNGIHST